MWLLQNEGFSYLQSIIYVYQVEQVIEWKGRIMDYNNKTINLNKAQAQEMCSPDVSCLLYTE